MKRAVKYSALAAAAVVGLSLGHTLGPADSVPAITRIDGQYLDNAWRHTLVLGFAASLVASVINIFVRESPAIVLATLFAASALWFTWFESAEPDFGTYLAGALAGFLFWLLAAATPVIVLFWLLDRRFRPDNDPGKDRS